MSCRAEVVVHLSMPNFLLQSQKWLLLLGTGSQAWCQSEEWGPILPSGIADRGERGVLGHLAAKWERDTEKLRIALLRYGIIPASVYQDRSVCAGKLRVCQQYLVVQRWCYLLRGFSVRHVLLLWCLTFSLICIRIHVGDLVEKPETSFILAFIIPWFLQKKKRGGEIYPNTHEALMCPEPQHISSSLSLVSEV